MDSRQRGLAVCDSRSLRAGQPGSKGHRKRKCLPRFKALHILYAERKREMTIQRLSLLAIAALMGLALDAQKRLDDSTRVQRGSDGSVMVTRSIDAEATEEVRKLVKAALALANEGNYDAATERLRHALMIDSSNVVVLANLGSFENLAGHPDRAIEYLERAWAASDPPNSAIAVNLGLAYYNGGNYEKSIAILSQAVPLLTDDVSLGAAYFNRCMAYAKSGECDLARKDRDQAKEKYRKVKPAKEELQRLDGMIERCKEN